MYSNGYTSAPIARRDMARPVSPSFIPPAQIWTPPMDDWFKATQQQLEAIGQAIEQQVDEAIDGVLEASDRLADQIDQALTPTLETLDQWETDMAKQIETWLPAVPVEAVEDFEHRIDQWTVQTGEAIAQALRPVEQTVKPMVNEHKPCIGCRNYHGETYGDNPDMLVCGIHPFGYDADSCPDWQSTWQPEDKD